MTMNKRIPKVNLRETDRVLEDARLIEEAKGRYVPHSVLDETYVIRLCFTAHTAAEEVAAKLDPEDIFSERNAKVFRAILSLLDAGLTITYYSVSQEIQGKDPEIIGEYDTLNAESLKDHYPVKDWIVLESLDSVVKRLKADTAYREIIYAANDALLMAKSREGSPEDILGRLDTLAATVVTKNNRVIVWFDEAEKEAQENYDKMDRGELVAIPTGFPEIDKHLYGGGVWGGDTVLISGATSGGKSTLAMNIAENIAELGRKSLYFSLEMKTFKLFSRVHSRRAKVPGYKIRPEMSKLYGSHVREKLRSTGEAISRLPIGVVDSVKDLQSIKRISKYAVDVEGVEAIFVDYIGLATPSKNYRGGRYERVSLVSEGLKELALTLNVPIFVLSQLRRPNESEKNEATKNGGNAVEPDLEMLKESGSLENDADTVIFIWGEKGKEGEREGIRDIKGKIAKQRSGGLERFRLTFAPDIFNFISEVKLDEMRKKEEAVKF